MVNSSFKYIKQFWKEAKGQSSPNHKIKYTYPNITATLLALASLTYFVHSLERYVIPKMLDLGRGGKGHPELIFRYKQYCL